MANSWGCRSSRHREFAGDRALWLQQRRRKRAELAVEGQCLSFAHANASLTMSETKNRAILNAVPDLMFIQTIDGVYVDCHFKDTRDLLLRPENFLGKNMSEVLPNDVADVFWNASNARASRMSRSFTNIVYR